MEVEAVTGAASLASLQVHTSDVRPPLWKTGTREVLQSEVDRRVQTGWEPLPNLPLLAVPVVALGTTPERMEKDAAEELRTAEDMLDVFEDAGASSGLRQVFSQHKEAMKTACLPKTGRVPRGACPTLVLLDGSHRWYTAVKLKKMRIWVSIPAQYQELFPATTVSDAIESSQRRDGAGQGAGEVPSVSAADAATAGARMNFVSHITTRMTVADRVFLLGSWYIGCMEACRDFDARVTLQQQLFVKNVYDLLCFSIHRDVSEAACRSHDFKAARIRGEKLSKVLDGDRGLEMYGTKVPLPPPFVLVVAPEGEGDKPRLCTSPEDLIRCSLSTAMSPIARKLTGAILRMEVEPDEEPSVDVESSRAEAANAIKVSSSIARVYSLSSVAEAISAALGSSSQADSEQLRQGRKPCLGRLETSLAILYSMQTMKLHDPGHDAQSSKGRPARRRVTWRGLHTIGGKRRIILRHVLSSLIQLWEERVSLKEITENVACVNVEALQGHRILGRTAGGWLDRSHMSLLIGTGPSKSEAVDGPKHTLRCFLLQADGEQCVCDWYRDRIAKSSESGPALSRDMLSKAWFRMNTGLATMQIPRKGQNASLSGQDVVDKFDLVTFKTEQTKAVSKIGSQVYGTISLVEAFLSSWRDQESTGNEGEDLAQLGVLRRYANGLLIPLHNLAREVGLFSSRHELDKYFDAVHQSLSRLEEVWNSGKHGPGLESVFEKYRDMVQEDEVDSVHSKARGQELVVLKTCDMGGVDVIARWKARLQSLEQVLRKVEAHAQRERRRLREQQTEERRRRQNDARKEKAAADKELQEAEDRKKAEASRRAASRAAEKRARERANKSRPAHGAEATVSDTPARPKRKRKDGCEEAGRKQSRTSSAANADGTDVEQGQERASTGAQEGDPGKCGDGGTADPSSGSTAVALPPISGPSAGKVGLGTRALENAIMRDMQTHDFDDIAGKVPDEILRDTEETVEDCRTALPPQITPGSNARYFVDVSTVEQIKKWAADVVRRSFSGKGGPAVYAKMSEVGYVCLRDVFCDDNAARTDVAGVIKRAVSSLELATDGGESVRDVASTVLIPNLDGGGRSQTGKGYWSRLERDGKVDLWEPARAFHRLVTRACCLVDEIVRAGRTSACACNEGMCDDGIGLSCPNTGGRVLISHPPSLLFPKGGSAQYPHMDFRRPTAADAVEASGFGLLPTPNHSTPMFVMCTGEQGAALRVLPGSSTWVMAPKALIKAACADTDWKLEWIPPFSFFAMRGDCVHAGAAFLESKWLHDCHDLRDIDCVKGFARFHMYFSTPRSGISNNIHLLASKDECPYPKDIVDPKYLMFPDTNGRVFKSVSEDCTFSIED